MARNSKTVEPDGTPVDAAEVAVRGPAWEDDTLLQVGSFADAMALAKAEFGELSEASDTLGNGFTILNDKAKDILIGQELILLSWNFNVGDMGPFVSIMCAAKMPGGGVMKAIVNDGSTGIYSQLDTLYRRNGKLGGLHVPRGLRRSDYTYHDENTGEDRPASTYYLDTAA